MKTLVKFKYILTITSMVFLLSNNAFAAGPPAPPGVPLDFGLIALIIACVGYGFKAIHNKKNSM